MDETTVGFPPILNRLKSEDFDALLAMREALLGKVHTCVARGTKTGAATFHWNLGANELELWGGGGGGAGLVIFDLSTGAGSQDLV